METLLSKYRKPLMGLAAIFILVYHTYAKFLMCIPFLGDVEDFIILWSRYIPTSFGAWNGVFALDAFGGRILY